MRAHNFRHLLEEASKWERIVAEYLADIIISESVKLASREEQKDGIDALVEKKSLAFDIKFRDSRYYLKGIAIELESVVERKVPGWFYTTKADAIVYLWWNEDKTGLMPIGYYLILSDGFRKWFEENKSKYEEKQASTLFKRPDGKTEIYHTKFVVVPIEDIPPRYLKMFYTPEIEPESKKKVTEFC